MKKILFFAVLFFCFQCSFAKGCVNSIDSFAVEVLLNKPDISYNLGKFSLAGEVIRGNFFSSNEYIFQSQYNKNLAVILSENSDLCRRNCVSVRLQIPAQTSQTKIPRFVLLSEVYGKKINLTEDVANYKEWHITFFSDSVELRKNNVRILVNPKLINPNNEVIIEINEKLQNCENCDGRCVSSQYGKLCINKKLKEEIEDVLKFSGIINNFDNLFSNYKVVENSEITLTDLKPEINPDSIDWEEALRQELVWLKNREIIDIGKEDIEKVVSLAGKGKAGHNSRIVYAENEDKWLYYYETKDAQLIQETNCEEFSPLQLPQNLPFFTNLSVSPYYLIPLMASVLLFLILFVLVLIARILNKKKSKKPS